MLTGLGNCHPVEQHSGVLARKGRVVCEAPQQGNHCARSGIVPILKAIVFAEPLLRVDDTDFVDSQAADVLFGDIWATQFLQQEIRGDPITFRESELQKFIDADIDVRLGMCLTSAEMGVS